MSTREIYEEYMRRFSYLPISEDKVEKFLKERPIFQSCEDMVYLINMLADWVGSQQEYEEGAEEAW